MQSPRSPQDPARFNVAPWLWKGVGMLCLVSAVGCGGGGSGGGSNPAPVVTPTPVVPTSPTPSPTPTANLGTLFVASPGSPGSVLAYPAAASGSPAPSYTLTSTSFNSPRGLTTDSTGALYVVNQNGITGSSSNIVVFAKAAMTPSKTITSSSLPGPLTTAVVDALGNIDVLGKVDVANVGSQYGVAVFASSASGTGANPTSTFTNTGNFAPVGIAVDSSTTVPNIYVASNALANSTNPNEIQEFPTGSTMDATPSNTITGSSTQLGTGGLSSLAIDSTGNIYASVAQATGNVTSILVFTAPPANTTGTPIVLNQAPSRVLTGSLTNLSNPSFMAFDTLGELYVQNNPAGSTPYVTVYASGASGNVAPLRTIQEAVTACSTSVPCTGGIAVAGP